jgi:hypothetical protein
MASSGSFTTSSEKNLSLMVSWSIKTQSIENNTSTITWTLKGYRTDGATGYITCGGFKVIINGVTVYSKPTDYRIDVYNGTVVASGNTTISHNADGTKSFIAYAEAGIYWSAVNCSGSGTFILNTIPRATTPTVSGTLSLGSSITISTSGRASTSFTHNLYYSWGSQVIDSLIASGVTTSKAWTIPKTLAEYIQAGTSGTMFLKCVTYNGSTEIGTRTLTLTISVPNTAEFKPTIQSISTAEANSLPFARYVVGKTQLTVSVTAVGAYVSGSLNRNSFPAKAVVTVDGVNYPVTLSQSSPSTWSIKTNLLISAGSKSGTVTITDSRGRTASKTFSYTVYAYAPPVISSFTARRCLADGTLDDSGTCILFGLKTTISSVDNQNAKTYKIVYESGGNEVTLESGTLSVYTNNVLSYNSYSDGVTFSVDNSWVVRVYVYDSFNADTPAVATVIVPTEATFMDWRTNGKGFAFGKVSTKDGFECGWPMFDRFDTSIGNGLVRYTGNGENAIDPNTTLEHQIVTDKNTPGSGFWYIETLFYSTKSDTVNRTQYAKPYSVSGSHYTRYYYNGVWSAWLQIDVVVESGTSGIWTYKKYASGEAECWGRTEITVNVTSAWGPLYTSGGVVDVAFPFTFAEIPIVNATLSGNSVGGFLMVTGNVAGGTTTTRTGYYEICRGSTISNGKFIVNFQVKGRWK